MVLVLIDYAFYLYAGFLRSRLCIYMTVLLYVISVCVCIWCDLRCIAWVFGRAFTGGGARLFVSVTCAGARLVGSSSSVDRKYFIHQVVI